MNAISFCTTLSLFSLSVSLPEGEHSWPQWDGPRRDGVSRETSWESVGAEKNLWTAEVGLGYSTFAVADGRVYTMGYEGEDEEKGMDSVFCFDALSGKELWRHSFPAKIWNLAHEGGTVNTPSIDGDVVYALNREGNLFCLDAKTGEVEWHTELKPEDNIYELEYPRWGFSASPLVLEDGLFVNCGKLMAIDEDSGDVLWVSKDYGHAYGTPAAFELEGEPLLAVLNGNGVAVVSREDGEELYFQEFGGTSRGVNAATPVVIDDALFVSSGTIPADALFAFGDGELIPVWENKEMVNSFSGCVRMGDHLYGFDQATLKCIDLEGKAAWDVRGIGNGALIGAGDRLLIMGGTGELIVAKATAEKFDELSRVKLFEEGRFWTRPILVDGIVYCRNSKGAVVARDHRKKN